MTSEWLVLTSGQRGGLHFVIPVFESLPYLVCGCNVWRLIMLSAWRWHVAVLWRVLVMAPCSFDGSGVEQGEGDLSKGRCW